MNDKETQLIGERSGYPSPEKTVEEISKEQVKLGNEWIDAQPKRTVTPVLELLGGKK